MKVVLVNHSDIDGGAARAVYRIHHSLRCYGVDSRLIVNNAMAGDWTVEGPANKWNKEINRLRLTLGGFLPSFLTKTQNPVLHSLAVLPSNWARQLNCEAIDVVHLHWVNGEMMSISDIGRIRKPVVWTLHDMWAFCGAEHYTDDFRWRDGYTRSNRSSQESRFDINRWTWLRKRKHWQHPMHIITPSRWMADCARASMLLHDWPITVVPNCIDTNIWQPVNKVLARQLLQLPPDVPLLLFGAMGGAVDHRKGFDLLRVALDHLRGEIPGLELVIFGQRAPKSVDLGFPVHYAGHLHDDVSLRLLYSAADVMVIPSRQDNLPNTGLEAHACGTPIVAFDACGLPDIVAHKQTGYLAKGFDTTDLATGLCWVLEDKARHALLSSAARNQAESAWSSEEIARQNMAVYQKAVDSY